MQGQTILARVMRFRRELLLPLAVIGGLVAYWIGSEVTRAAFRPTELRLRDFFGRFGEPRGIAWCSVMVGAIRNA